jgi:hypothetical protein
MVSMLINFVQQFTSLCGEGGCGSSVIQGVCIWTLSPDCQQTNIRMLCPGAGLSAFRPCLTVLLPMRREETVGFTGFAGFRHRALTYLTINTGSQEADPGGRILSQLATDSVL